MTINSLAHNCKIARSYAASNKPTCKPGECILDAGPFIDECRKCGAVTPLIS